METQSIFGEGLLTTNYPKGNWTLNLGIVGHSIIANNTIDT